MASNLDLVAKLDYTILAFAALNDLVAGGEEFRLNSDDPKPLWNLLELVRSEFLIVRNELHRRDL